MNWLVTAIIAVTLVVIIGATGLGIYRSFRSPKFYIGFIKQLAKELMPLVSGVYLRLAVRMKPEDEKKFHASVRHGAEWDPFRKQERESHK